MRGVFLGAVVVGLVIGGVVAGARAFTGGSSAGEQAAPTAAAGSPRATAEAFAKAWSLGDPPALYQMITPESQRAHPLSTFAAAYESFASETTLEQLSASVRAVDGDTASLAVHLATGYFGDFDYEVTLNLSKATGQYLVTWEPTAIHPAMAGGRAFRSTIERPKRGAILDRSGAPLAVTREERMLGLNRSVVGDRAGLTAALVEFGFTKEQVDAAFADPAGPTQRVAVGPVADEQKEAAAALLRIPGILLYVETHRVHPLGTAATHVVGYTRELTAEELAQRRGQGYRPGDRVGAVGLEASLEPVLAGRTGAELRLVDVDGATVETLKSTAFVPGQDVSSTLDAGVLAATAARLGSRAGAAVVIDPRTNAILALNSAPAYDPDAFERNDRAALAAIIAAPGSPQANRATTGLYSAGSTFKLITGAAGLAYGGYTPSDRIECGSVWRGLDPPRRNWEGAQGPLTIAQGLMRSCNTVFYEIALKLYNQTAAEDGLSKMARAFGFGSATGVVGLGEEDGQVPDAAWKRAKKNEPWYPGDEVNLGIGQGDLLITPLQLANAYSTFIAGELRTPVLLASEKAVSRGALPLTDVQHAHLQAGLQLVTSSAGTAAAAFADAGYTNFAGKSGTAEDAGSQQHVLFVAYAPASAPRAVAAVVLDEGKSGSVEAGPIARDLVLAALR